MIPFQTWLAQIIGYGRFIADDLGVRRAWIDEDYSRTSITNFDELYEQIFDDLDSDTIEQALPTFLPNDPDSRAALTDFLSGIRSIDALRENNKDLRSPNGLLASQEWGNLVETARRMTSKFSLPDIHG